MSAVAVENVLRRDRAIVIFCLAAITALAWGYTVWLAENMRMGGTHRQAMEMGALLAPAFKPWTAADFIVMFVMWTVMMVGMMLPSVAPMVLLYARVGRLAAFQGKPLAGTSFFAGGYLLAWTAFSFAATAGQWLLERAALLTPMMTTNNILGGIVLISAGLFQWTSAKDACLKYCQAPLNFIQQHGGFRPSLSHSLNLGFRHGLYCVGCCWALMALLFVGGVMNIVWIAGLTIFVLLEKIVPSGRIVSRAAGVGLLVWGLALLIAEFG